MIAAARLPLRSDPANNPFDRPSAHGRIKFSTGLLDVNQVLRPLCEHGVSDVSVSVSKTALLIFGQCFKASTVLLKSKSACHALVWQPNILSHHWETPGRFQVTSSANEE